MPGPSFAPFLGRVGVFVARVRGRRRRHLAAGRRSSSSRSRSCTGGARRSATTTTSPRRRRHVVVGMLAAPAGTPPEGVHIPPPVVPAAPRRGRAWRCSCSGLVFGGWALFLGFIVLVDHAARLAAGRAQGVPRASSIADAHRPPRHGRRTRVAQGDVRRARRCSWPSRPLLSSGILPNSGGSAPRLARRRAPAPAGGGAPPPASAAPSRRPRTSASRRRTSQFEPTKSLTVPAGKPFTIAFDNQDTGSRTTS